MFAHHHSMSVLKERNRMPQWNPLPSETVQVLRESAAQVANYAETIASTEPENANVQQLLAYVQEATGQVQTLCLEHDRFRQFWQPKP
jgi:hypothetical protein